MMLHKFNFVYYNQEDESGDDMKAVDAAKRKHEEENDLDEAESFKVRRNLTFLYCFGTLVFPCYVKYFWIHFLELTVI